MASESTSAMRWLLAVYLLQLLASVPAIFCEAFGRPEINNGFSAATAVVSVPLVLLLVPVFGITGAAIALFLAIAAQTIAFVTYSSRRVVGLGLWELFTTSVARPLAAVLIAGAVGFLVRPLVRDLVSLAFALALMLATYLVAALGLGAVTREDLGYLARFVASLPMWVPGRESILRRIR